MRFTGLLEQESGFAETRLVKSVVSREGGNLQYFVTMNC